MNTVKGKGLLKVTGILMIIGGILCAILALIGILGAGLILAGSSNPSIAGLSGYTSHELANVGNFTIVASVVAIIGGIIELVGGILGVKKSGVPNSAKPCVVVGIIIIAFSLVSTVFTLLNSIDNINFFSLLSSSLIGLVLPILYLVGAALNLKN